MGGGGAGQGSKQDRTGQTRQDRTGHDSKARQGKTTITGQPGQYRSTAVFFFMSVPDKQASAPRRRRCC